jgi:hypothetical protein
MVAAHRFDHPSITDRSRGQRLVHPSITRHSVAPQRLNDGIPKRPYRGPGVLQLHPPARKGAACATPSPHPVRQPPEPVNPAKTTQRQTSPQHRRGPTLTQQPGGRTPGQGCSPSRANSPTSHLRPTRSSARIRLIDHPARPAAPAGMPPGPRSRAPPVSPPDAPATPPPAPDAPTRTPLARRGCAAPGGSRGAPATAAPSADAPPAPRPPPPTATPAPRLGRPVMCAHR